MVYNLIIWTAFSMALLIIASLYFSYLKLKIHYRGIKCFIVGQLLVATSLFLLWFLNDQTYLIIAPLIGLFLFSGAFLFHESVVKFGKITSKSIDLYILIPLGFMLYNYVIYFQDNIMMEVIVLYLVASYAFIKSAILLYVARNNHEDGHLISTILTTAGFGILYIFRVLTILWVDPSTLNYSNLKDYQTVTVVFTFLLQIFITFNVSNIIFTRARSELNKINSGFHHSPVSMAMINAKHEVVDINNRFTEFLGYGPEQIIGKKLEQLQMFKHICDDHAFIKCMIDNKQIHNKEFSVFKSDGTIKQTLISFSKIDYVDQQNAMMTLTDISELHLLTEKLTDYAYYDDLTKLPNRRYLTRYFEAKVVENKRFALMFLDLDNFKDVNDTYGHVVGDEVLQLISKRLLKAICEHDFVARYAGDEFILILDLDDKEQSLDYKISKIITVIEEPINLIQSVFSIKASIGLAEFPLHGSELSELMRQADGEMYHIKSMSKTKTHLQP